MVKRIINEEKIGKRAQIRDWFLESIRSGRLKPGDIAPTRFKLARTFGCSRATADYAIKNLASEKVLSARRGKGTFILPPGGRSPVDAIAVINCNPLFSWSTEIDQALFEGLSGSKRTTRFALEEIRRPSGWEACKNHIAIAFIMPEADHASFLRDARTSGVPHLVLYRDPPESPFISIDHRAAGRALVAALASRGRRRIAWMSFTESRFKTPEERYAGFLEGLLEQGLPFRKEWAGFFTAHEETEYLRSLFAGPEKPDALVLAQAPMGPAIRVIQEARLQPGTDVAMAQMDEIAPGQYPFPVLCTEKLTKTVGREAAGAVLRGEKLADSRPLRQYLTPAVLEC